MLDALHHFLLIARHGTFRAAARHAHLSQPALSASIQRLEETLHARLLHRDPTGARPTAAGEALLPHARAALAAVEAGRRAVAEVEGLTRGRVRLGGGSIACTWLLPPLLARFRALHPAVELRLRELFTPQVQAAVLDGELDLGVAADLPAGPGVDPWRLDPLVLVASPDYAARLPPGPLPAGTPALSFQPGASLREALDQHLPELEVAIELGSLAALKGMLRAGMGVGLLSRSAVATDLQLGRLVELPDPRTPPPRCLQLVHPGLDRLSPAARALRTLILAESDPSIHAVEQPDDLAVVEEQLLHPRGE